MPDSHLPSPVDGVLPITLDWPGKRNALGPDQADLLAERLSGARDLSCRCVVLRAEGDVFCAGGDLRAVMALVEEGEDSLRNRLYRSFQGLFRAVRKVPVPVLAAVAGPAVGLGFDLALACDWRYFGPRAWARQGWSALGLIPATGGFLDLRGAGGPGAPWRLLTAGDRKIGADELQAWGLGEAVPDAEVAAFDAAATLARQPRDRLVATKGLVREADTDRHLAMALDAQVAFLLDERFRSQAEALLGEG